MPVRPSPRDRLEAEIAGGAGQVLDDDGLAELLRHRAGKDARDGVLAAACGDGDDEADGA